MKDEKGYTTDIWEPKVNRKIEWELNKQFPKGDKARGKAMVLFAMAQYEFDKQERNIENLKKKIEVLKAKLKGGNN